ncbi:unnamed protein product [Rhodiola kirilowii]
MSSSGKGIDDLQDDHFEGSRKEHCIFKEVYFGCKSGSTTRRCLVTGAIVFEPELSNHADTPLSSNSLQSDQASSKDCDIRDDHAPSATCTGIIEQDCSHETLSDGQNETAKGMKMSAGQSVQSKVINFGVSCPVTETFCKTITCRLVESSSQGVTYSSYLLKKPFEATREGACEEEVPTCELLCLKDNSFKEVVVSKSIASPISQESSADKVLVAGHYIAGVDKSTLSCSEGREKELSSHDLHLSSVPDSSKVMSAPRRLIQDQINHLLEATGWQYELRKKRNSRQRFSVYLSPEGKSFREFPKVWQSLGQNLLGKKFKFWQQTSVKHWKDIDQFSSDLSEALMHINKRMIKIDLNKPLADIWILLHPFVVVVFIDKKIGVLRKRNVVGATKGLLIDDAKCEASLSMENPDMSGHKMAPDQLFDSHMTLETESVVVEGNRGIGHGSRDMHACKAVPRELHERNNVSLRGHDRYLSSSYQLRGLSETPLQPDFYKHSISEVGCLPDLDNVALLQEKKGDLSPSLHARHFLQNGEKELQGAESVVCNESSGDCENIKRKMRKKSKKISEIKGSSLYRNEILGLTSCTAHESHYPGQPEFRHSEEIMGDMSSPAEDSVIVNESVDFQDCKVIKSRKPKPQSDGKIRNDQMNDGDLLVSAIMQKKYSIHSDKDTRVKVTKPKFKRKLKSLVGRHKLPTQNVVKSRHLTNGKYIPMGPRTVLSWLIDTGAVSLNDVIQCRDSRYPAAVKDGLVTRDGILCGCCNVVFSASLFKMHSGASQNHPFTDLCLENGKSYIACLLEAWSAEYETRRTSMNPSQVEDLDANDDTCGICGDGGDLICCDGCPSTFHQTCLATQDLPDGNWYCSTCTCRICGDLVSNSSPTIYGLECKQCETKYHEACLKEMGLDEVVNSETWFCGRNCEEVYSGLQAQVGVPQHVSNGISWILLRCFHDDQKICSPKRIALKAECNPKLAVALSIMEESFSAMCDPRTGINMIPHMIYNCGSNFARMDFHGFYTVVLEKDDILTSVASIRIHGVTIAEMPMVATCSRYRRQGMCRRLMDAIEEMLMSLKIEKLVISALPDLVETWTVGFGFQSLEDYEKESLNGLNLMVLPGTILLKKPLYSSPKEEPKDYEEPWSGEDYPVGADHTTIHQQHNNYVDDRELEDDNPKDKHLTMTTNL